MAELTPQQIIDHLKLEPLAQEGGYFRRTYSSADVLPVVALPERYGVDKLAGSAIYFLLTDAKDGFSALHRLPTDEIYHFYLGDPVELVTISPEGDLQVTVLGQDILNGQQVQAVAPAGWWQGSRLTAGGEYALLGTTMAPAFTEGDYEHGIPAELLVQFPQHTTLIRRFTRP
ncbi:MAG: cupin domain-containing protein [Anaerolineales bacterium]|jgi:hypothetical protein